MTGFPGQVSRYCETIRAMDIDSCVVGKRTAELETADHGWDRRNPERLVIGAVRRF